MLSKRGFVNYYWHASMTDPQLYACLHAAYGNEATEGDASYVFDCDSTGAAPVDPNIPPDVLTGFDPNAIQPQTGGGG